MQMYIEENRVHAAFLSPEDVSREVCRNLFMTPWYLNSVNAEVDQLLIARRLFSSEHCDTSPLLTEASQCRQTCYIDWLTDLLYRLVDRLVILTGWHFKRHSYLSSESTERCVQRWRSKRRRETEAVKPVQSTFGLKTNLERIGISVLNWKIVILNWSRIIQPVSVLI